MQATDGGCFLRGLGRGETPAEFPRRGKSVMRGLQEKREVQHGDVKRDCRHGEFTPYQIEETVRYWLERAVPMADSRRSRLAE